MKIKANLIPNDLIELKDNNDLYKNARIINYKPFYFCCTQCDVYFPSEGSVYINKSGFSFEGFKFCPYCKNKLQQKYETK